MSKKQSSQEILTPTYEQLDFAMRAFEAASVGENRLMPVSDVLERLRTVYGAVRPLLLIVAALPVIPPHWAAAVRVLDTTIKELLQKYPPKDFKAGKDL